MKTTDARSTRSWCLFRSNARHYAMPLASVVEVVEAEGVTPLPFSPDPVLGVFPYRRDVIPIVAPHPDHPRGEPGAAPGSVVLIASTEQGFWGMPIDREGTHTTDEVVDGPDATAFPDAIRRGGQHYVAIDPEHAWRGVRELIEAWYFADGRPSEVPPIG